MRHVHNSPVGRKTSILTGSLCAHFQPKHTRRARLTGRQAVRLSVLAVWGVTATASLVVTFLLSPSYTKSTAAVEGRENKQRGAISLDGAIIIVSRAIDRMRIVVANANGLSQTAPPIALAHSQCSGQAIAGKPCNRIC